MFWHFMKHCVSLIVLLVCFASLGYAHSGGIHIAVRTQREEAYTETERMSWHLYEQTMDFQWKHSLDARSDVFFGGTYTLLHEELYVDNGEENVRAETDRRNGFSDYHIGVEFAFDSDVFENTWRVSWHVPSNMQKTTARSEFPVSSPNHEIQGQWIISRTRDPVVVYAGASVVYSLTRRNDFVKGHHYTWQSGIIYALTRDTSIRGALAVGRKAPDRTRHGALYATKSTDIFTTLNITHLLHTHIAAEIGARLHLTIPEHSLLQLGVRYIL